MNGVKDMNRIDRASGPSVFRPVLRVLCLLAALLLVAAAAAGEGANPDWEERLALARAKYNEKTVNVYERGRGKYRKGKINACYYPSDIKPYININVRESLQITDEAEMEAILEQVVKHRYYTEERYGTISFMKAQWIAHNLAHSMATGTEEQQMLVKMLAGEDLAGIVSSAEQLDLSPIGSITDRQMMLYELVEMFFCTKAE